jgi:hypothetical protein
MPTLLAEPGTIELKGLQDGGVRLTVLGEAQGRCVRAKLTRRTGEEFEATVAGWLDMTAKWPRQPPGPDPLIGTPDDGGPLFELALDNGVHVRAYVADGEADRCWLEIEDGTDSVDLTSAQAEALGDVLLRWAYPDSVSG